MIRAFLVDDEPPARARLRQLLGEAGDVLVVGEAGNAEDARGLIAETRPDVVFLDIEMPQTRGTTLAASLPEPRPFIVFATAFDKHAIDAFALAATDYLLNRSRGRDSQARWRVFACDSRVRRISIARCWRPPPPRRTCFHESFRPSPALIARR